MKTHLDLSQRIHNAYGSQMAENCHAEHCWLHSRGKTKEEWDRIWTTSDDASWAHRFGRMRGYASVYKGNVTNYDAILYGYYNSIFKIYPQVGGKDPGPLAEVSMHVLDTDVIEVADDGMTARGAFFTPGIIFCRLTPEQSRRCTVFWEHYGSDFVYENGEWRYLHEQVCPDMECELDFENWAREVFLKEVSNVKKTHKLASTDAVGSNTAPEVEDPGPLHNGYNMKDKLWDSVPYPVPYATMDDNNTYTVRYKSEQENR